MLSALQFEWLLLFICSILLILVGCSVMPKPRVNLATPEPSVTFALVPFATESPQFLTLQPPLTLNPNIASEQISYRYTSTAPPPEPPPFVEAPTCFGRVNGGLSCFGKLWNKSSQAIGGAYLQVEVLDEQSQTLLEQKLSLEQAMIPSDTFASYRVLLDPLNNKNVEIDTTIVQQLPTQLSLVTLTIANERGLIMESGRYRLTATIENDWEDAIDHIRVFATLMNAEREIIGYRIYEVDGALQATERKAIDFEIIPQVYTSDLSHVLHVEGRIESLQSSNAENRRP